MENKNKRKNDLPPHKIKHIFQFASIVKLEDNKRGDVMSDEKPKEKKEDLGYRFLQSLGKSKVNVVLNLFGGDQIIGKLKGAGRYNIVVESEGRTILVFKHCIRTIYAQKKLKSTIKE